MRVLGLHDVPRNKTLGFWSQLRHVQTCFRKSFKKLSSISLQLCRYTTLWNSKIHNLMVSLKSANKALQLHVSASRIVDFLTAHGVVHLAEPGTSGSTNSETILPVPYETAPAFPQIDVIGAMVIVWRVRGKIIRSVLCTIVAHNIAQNRHDNFPLLPSRQSPLLRWCLFEGRGAQHYTFRRSDHQVNT